jgi:hypothetical protein
VDVDHEAGQRSLRGVSRKARDQKAEIHGGSPGLRHWAKPGILCYGGFTSRSTGNWPSSWAKNLATGFQKSRE